MCMLFLYVNDDCDDDGYRVIIANNRDEYWDRPTEPASFWGKNCISGLDKEPGKEGGTWLGACKNGRIGILLNILGYFEPQKKGRGHFIKGYLTSEFSGNDYIKQYILPYAAECNMFNLILINLGCKESDINYFNNLDSCHIENVDQGIHVFDNSTPKNPWQKSIFGKERYKKIIEKFGKKSSKNQLIGELMHLLSDKTQNNIDNQLASQAAMAKLPQKCIGERSANFVFSPSVRYGTRTHTLLLVDKNRHCEYIERTLKMPVDPENLEWETNSYRFFMDGNVHSKLC